jgi:hypothetical protein
MAHVVTKESFTALVTRGDAVAMHAIGKALVHLLRRQTDDEQRNNDVKYHNEMGFTPADGRSGCIGAKYYIKHGCLQDWQINMWLKPNKKGTPRIAKYWKQMDEEAKKKQASRQLEFTEREYREQTRGW